MKAGDIVLIRFPQADLQTGKLRPALIIAAAPGPYADLLLALISSRTYQAIPELDEIIDPADADYPATGLKARSVIRITRLASVETAVITAGLGHITPERLQTVKHRLITWLQQT